MSFAPPPAGISAMPLAALPTVAPDTETTGLEAGDRVVEIGAVRLESGTPSGDSFSTLVVPFDCAPRCR